MEKEYDEVWKAVTMSGNKGSLRYLIEHGYQPKDKEIADEFCEGNRCCLEYLMGKDEYLAILKKMKSSVQDEAVYNVVQYSEEWGVKMLNAGIMPDDEGMGIIMEYRYITLAKKIVDMLESEDDIIMVLKRAVQFGNAEMVEYILEKHIDINHKIVDKNHEPEEYYIIHEAAQNASTSILKMLLEHGADPSLKDSDGEIPADWAGLMEFSKHKDILEQYK